MPELANAAAARQCAGAMSLFLLRRFLTFVATLAATSVIIFVVLEILPGDPALTMLGLDAPESAVREIRAELGLDRPAHVRYFDWIGGLFVGDLGLSYTYKVPVSELVRERLAVTLPLALLAMALTVLIALSLGLFAASHHNRLGDYGVMGFSQLGIAIPNFWFGILLILAFAVGLRWVSAGGFAGWENGLWPGLRSLLLPAITLALSLSAILTRITRSAVLETAGEDYVRTARAKGLSRGATMRRHVLRNALIPVITIGGLIFADLLAGTIIVERVFSLPGIGKLVFQAITNRDLMVVKSVVLLLAALVVVMNFLVDITYALIDPRIRLGGRA